MRTRLFGSTGRRVPIVGQGSWPLPDVRALRRGIELGMTHIDTAEMYGDGRSEELVGEAIAPYPRESLFLVSKVLPSNGGKGALERACEASLRRLGVDEFDCYLLHWRGDVDLAETMAGLERLLAAGKTRAIGVSNLDPWDMREAEAALRDATIACNQLYYNLEERTIEEFELPLARERGHAVVAYTPLGGAADGGAGGRVLREIARERGCTPHAVALAFLLRDESVFVIPKASRVEHVEANAVAGELALHPDDLARIDAAFPRRERTGALPMN